VAAVDDQVQDLVVRRVDAEQVHARRGDHHVAGGHVGHADHALEHHARLGGDQLAVLGVGQSGDQLVGRIRAGVDELDDALEKIALFGGCLLVRSLARLGAAARA